MITKEDRLVKLVCTKCGTIGTFSSRDKEWTVCPKCGGKRFYEERKEVITK